MRQDAMRNRADRARLGFVRVLALCALPLLVLAIQCPARAQTTAAPAACQRAHDGIDYLCGPQNVEDMELIPGRGMLIASSYDLPAGATGLNLINTETRTVTPLAITMPSQPIRLYAACPSALNLTHFFPHGIALRHGADNQHTLYVVNHGSRESVEVFAVDARQPAITARWLGCVVLPEGASGNAVAPTNDSGFVVTKFYDTRQPEHAQFVARQRTPVVYHWSPHAGISVVPGGEAVGDNGILVSADGQWVYVTSWIERRVIRLPLTPGAAQITSTALDFMPDNLRWAPDGSIFVTGQATDVDLLFACKHPRCPLDWAIAQLDPQAMSVSYLYWEKGTPDFAGATTAVQVGNKLWIGTFHGDRIAIADVPAQPLHP